MMVGDYPDDVDGHDDDGSRRCFDCRQGFWPDTGGAICERCEEWFCLDCRAVHICDPWPDEDDDWPDVDDDADT